MEAAPLSTLRPKGPTPPIEIRVIRKWETKHRADETHYIFTDKEGSGIQAIVKGAEQITVVPKLHIKVCYRIHGYACVDPDEYTNTLSHPATIYLGRASKINQLPNSDVIPHHHFDIASRRRFLAQSKHTNGIIDYIGIIATKLEDRKTRDMRPYATFMLRDSSNKNIPVIFWDKVMTSTLRFNRQMVETAPDPKIIAITAAKVKDHPGVGLQLQSTDATYIYLNPQIIETATLTEMFNNPTIQPQPVTSAIQNYTTITSLEQKNNKDLQDNTFTIEGTITDVDTLKDWYYIACPKCNKAAMQTGDDWFCPTDDYLKETPQMFKITATISDQTGSAVTTIFDRAANQLLGQTCREINAHQNPTGEILKIINTKAYFHITAKRDGKGSSLRLTANAITPVATPSKDAQGSSTTDVHTPQQPAKESRPQSSSTAKRQLIHEQDNEDSTAKKAKTQSNI